jgi:hypothetical protein
MSNLKKQAEDLGIKVDGRWSDDRIQQEIDSAKKSQPFGGKGDHDGNGKVGGAAAPVSQAAIEQANMDTLPTLGGPRVASSQEIREEQAGANLEVAPYPADPVEAHKRAVELSQNPAPAPEFQTSDIEKGETGEDLYPIRLLNDWWDGQGIRHKRGDLIEVPYNEAIRLVGDRKAERADAFSARRG